MWAKFMGNKKIKVTLIRGINKKLKTHKACVRGLGLKRINDSVEVENTPAVCGMIAKVSYLLKVEDK